MKTFTCEYKNGYYLLHTFSFSHLFIILSGMVRRNVIDADFIEDENGDKRIRFYYKKRCYVSQKYKEDETEKYMCRLWDETDFDNKIDIDSKKAFEIKEYFKEIDIVS